MADWVTNYQKAHMASKWQGKTYNVEKNWSKDNPISVSHALMTNKSLFDNYKEKAGSKNINDILNTAVNDLTINGEKIKDTNGDGKITWEDANSIKMGDELAFGANKKADEKTYSPFITDYDKYKEEDPISSLMKGISTEDLLTNPVNRML